MVYHTCEKNHSASNTNLIMCIVFLSLDRQQKINLDSSLTQTLTSNHTLQCIRSCHIECKQKHLRDINHNEKHFVWPPSPLYI